MTPAELELQTRAVELAPADRRLDGVRRAPSSRCSSFGRGPLSLDPRTWAVRIADSLERLTRIPGWAAAMVGTSTFGSARRRASASTATSAGTSASDVTTSSSPLRTPRSSSAWRRSSARPSSASSSRRATKANVGLRIPVIGIRVPYSALAMGLIGLCALSGFPMDELWHRAYGIDVTMWSPTHLLMIVGAVDQPARVVARAR